MNQRLRERLLSMEQQFKDPLEFIWSPSRDANMRFLDIKHRSLTHHGANLIIKTLSDTTNDLDGQPRQFPVVFIEEGHLIFLKKTEDRWNDVISLVEPILHGLLGQGTRTRELREIFASKDSSSDIAWIVVYTWVGNGSIYVMDQYLREPSEQIYVLYRNSSCAMRYDGVRKSMACHFGAIIYVSDDEYMCLYSCKEQDHYQMLDNKTETDVILRSSRMHLTVTKDLVLEDVDSYNKTDVDILMKFLERQADIPQERSLSYKNGRMTVNLYDS